MPPASRPLSVASLVAAPLVALVVYAAVRAGLHQAWGLPLVSPGAGVLGAALAACCGLVLEEPALAPGGAALLARLGAGLGLLTLGESLLYYRVDAKASVAALGFAALGVGALLWWPRRTRGSVAAVAVLAVLGVGMAHHSPAGGWDLFAGPQHGQWLVWLFWLGLAATLLTLAATASAPPPGRARPPLDRWVEWALLGGVLLVGALLRFWQAGHLPQGYWYDEVNLSRAIQDHVLVGKEVPLYLGEQVENPGAYLWVGAAAFRFFGVHIVVLRVLAGVFGLLAVIPFWALARLWLGARWGLVAAFLFACMRWVLIPQRIAFMSGFALFWMLAAFWALWSAQCRLAAKGAWPWRWLLAGALLGANLHTYTPARIVPPLALAFLAIQAWLDPAWRRRGRDWLALGAGFLVVGGPMLAYIALHWGEYLSRTAQVSIFTDVKVSGHPLVPEILISAAKHALMFQFRGDYNARQNLSFYPQVDPLLAAALGLALPWTLGQAHRDARARFLWLWLPAMLAAGVLSLPVEAPQAHRCILAAPVLPLMVALALRGLLGARGPELGGAWPLSLKALGLVLLLGMGVLNAVELLGQWPGEEATFRSFSPRASAVMGRIERTGPGTVVLTSPLSKEYQFYGYEWGVFARFVLRQQGRDWAALGPSQAVPPSDGGQPTDSVLMVWGDSDTDITAAYQREFPGRPLEKAPQPFPGPGEPNDLYVAAQVPWGDLPTRPKRGPAPLLYRSN